MATNDPRAGWAEAQRELIEQVRTQGKVTSGPFAGRDVLLLTTKGARTGETRVAPVVFSRDGDHMVIVASKGGAPNHPSWYANLLAHPIVTVETGGEKFEARATPIPDGPERDRLYAQHAAQYPGFLDYERKTSRVIPIVLLDRVETA